MEDPINLKTLAQFILLADPSLQPCRAEGREGAENLRFVDQVAAREMRRVALVAAGRAAAESSGFPGKKLTRLPKGLKNMVLKLARQKGFRGHVRNLVAFQVAGRGNYALEMKVRDVEQKALMLMEHAKPRGKAARAIPKGLQQTRVLVAHVQDNRLVEIAEYVRR
jgi:hypothetical protein